MIAVDTNVLVRFSVGDHPEQGSVAQSFFNRLAESGETAFVTAVTFAEFVWVLQKRYGVASDALPAIVETLLNVPSLEFEHDEAIRRAAAPGRGDFVDRFIHSIGAAAGCERTVTFDRTFAKLDGVELLGR